MKAGTGKRCGVLETNHGSKLAQASNDGTEASGQCKPDGSDDQMNEKDDEITHPGMVSNPKKTVISSPIQ